MPRAAGDAPSPQGNLKAACQGSLISIATASQALGPGLSGWGPHGFAVSALRRGGSGSPVQARAWLPAAFQLPLPGTCASASGLRPNPTAPTPPSIRQRAKRKGAQFCFSAASLIFLSDACPIFPSLHHLLHARRGGGACSYCPGKQETRALDSQDRCLKACWRVTLQGLSPTHHGAPGLAARCQPGALQLPPLCHVPHSHSGNFTSPSSGSRPALPPPLLQRLAPGMDRSLTNQTGGPEPTVS